MFRDGYVSQCRLVPAPDERCPPCGARASSARLGEIADVRRRVALEVAHGRGETGPVRSAAKRTSGGTLVEPYRLNEQIGFTLRQVAQRHAAIFAAGVDNEITATQWAALVKLHESGPLSQNLLGRLTVMDAATIKGVIDRLSRRALTLTRSDPSDGRRRLVDLTPAGREMVLRLLPLALEITEETLRPLDADERAQLALLLGKLC